MFEPTALAGMAQSLAAHSSARLELVARNVANADTPGYRAVDLQSFASVYGDDAPAGLRSSRPAHIALGATRQTALPTAGPADPNGNGVTLETEMMRLASIRADHDMALATYRSNANILRACLGRRG